MSTRESIRLIARASSCNGQKTGGVNFPCFPDTGMVRMGISREMPFFLHKQTFGKTTSCLLVLPAHIYTVYRADILFV